MLSAVFRKSRINEVKFSARDRKKTTNKMYKILLKLHDEINTGEVKPILANSPLISGGRALVAV